MTDLEDAQAFARARDLTIRLYLAIDVLMGLGIVVLAIYSFKLGPLIGPGVEQSFGFAISLMLLMGAMLVHTTDRAYRLWPLGRKTRPFPPEVVSDSDVATFLKVLVIVAAGAAIAYVLGSLIAG